ncbi:SapC protein [Hyphomicrobiales bacterium]|nr:SapC protein [Hyphomicrobiales bacterium]CAH1683172.1 SapC protein [Hyphomicrobiales bacterium]
MYKNLAPFSYGRKRLELFSTVQYKHLNKTITFPVSLVELNNVAHSYPVVWQRNKDGVELVALVGLEPDHNYALSGHPNFVRCNLLILEAYPFALGKTDKEGHWQILVDEVIGQGEDDPAALRNAEGELSEEADHRLSALRVFAESYGRTQTLSQQLDQAGLLKPWDVSLKIGDRFVGLRGLEVLDRDVDIRRLKLAGVIEQVGWDAIHLATMHELSLFRMQNLLEARTAAQAA